MKNLKIFKNSWVIVTGHTGFNGSWLTAWLKELGANIIEVSMGFLTHIQYVAKEYCLDNGAHLIPFGGDHPIIVRAMCEVAKSLNINPK